MSIQTNLGELFTSNNEFDANVTIVVGNSSSNSIINSTAFSLSNSTSNTTLKVPNTTAWSATNYFLHANGSWVEIISGSSGSNTYVQFNDSGSLGGDAGFTYDKISTTLLVGNSTSNVTVTPNSISIIESSGNLVANSTSIVLQQSGYQTTLQSYGAFFYNSDIQLYKSNSSYSYAKIQAFGSANDTLLGIASLDAGNSFFTIEGQIYGHGSTPHAKIEYFNENNLVSDGTSITTDANCGIKFYSYSTVSGIIDPIMVLSSLNGGLYFANSTANLVLKKSTVSLANSSMSSNLQLNQLNIGANTYVNSTSFFQGNSSVNTVISANSFTCVNSGYIALGTINATAQGMTANVTTFQIGNSTINAVINSSTISINKSTEATIAFSATFPTMIRATGGSSSGWMRFTGGNNGKDVNIDSSGFVNSYGFYVGGNAAWGSATSAFAANASLIGIGNSTANSIQTVSAFSLANSTISSNLQLAQINIGANVYANSTSFYLGNSTVNTTIGQQTASLFTNSTATALSVAATGNVSIPKAVLTTIYANGASGTSGQVLTSNSTGGAYWASASAGGATLTANNTDTQTFYIPMSNTTSGSWTNAVVSDTDMYFVPSTGTLSAIIFNSLSDENKKENIQIINDSLNKLSQIKGVTFNWKTNGNESVGVIAQDVEKVFPCLVDQNKNVNYDGLIGLLVEAIKDLKKEINELKNGG